MWLGVGTKHTEDPKSKMQWVAGALPLGLCVAMSMRVESRGEPLGGHTATEPCALRALSQYSECEKVRLDL